MIFRASGPLTTRRERSSVSPCRKTLGLYAAGLLATSLGACGTPRVPTVEACGWPTSTPMAFSGSIKKADLRLVPNVGNDSPETVVSAIVSAAKLEVPHRGARSGPGPAEHARQACWIESDGGTYVAPIPDAWGRPAAIPVGRGRATRIVIGGRRTPAPRDKWADLPVGWESRGLLVSLASPLPVGRERSHAAAANELPAPRIAYRLTLRPRGD